MPVFGEEKEVVYSTLYKQQKELEELEEMEEINKREDFYYNCNLNTDLSLDE